MFLPSLDLDFFLYPSQLHQDRGLPSPCTALLSLKPGLGFLCEIEKDQFPTGPLPDKLPQSEAGLIFSGQLLRLRIPQKSIPETLFPAVNPGGTGKKFPSTETISVESALSRSLFRVHC